MQNKRSFRNRCEPNESELNAPKNHIDRLRAINNSESTPADCHRQRTDLAVRESLDRIVIAVNEFVANSFAKLITDWAASKFTKFNDQIDQPLSRQELNKCFQRGRFQLARGRRVDFDCSMPSSRTHFCLIKNARERSTSAKLGDQEVTFPHFVQKMFLSQLFQNAVKTSHGGRPPLSLAKEQTERGRVIKFAKFNEPTPSRKDAI